VVILNKFPLTVNGKIDRQGLPEPEAVSVYVAPRTAMEEAVAAIWSEVLNRDRMGVTDDFFELGGHSLIATQIASRLRTRFGLNVPVRMLFDCPTIASLAQALEQRRGELAESSEIKIAPRDRAAWKQVLAPRNQDEEKMAAIWAEVLGEKVGVEDNFFALGGHSLLAIQIISRIRKKFRLDFPLRALLENPTVAGVAGKLKDFASLSETEEEEIARLLREVEDTSEEKAERLLASEAEDKSEKQRE
jgi:acyl carrier protein